MSNGCLKEWKNWQRFSLQWYSSYNRWYESEICDILKRLIFDIKTARFSVKSRNKINLPELLWASLSCLILGCLYRPPPQLPKLDMILAECKQLPHFQLWWRRQSVNGAERLDFVICGTKKECKCSVNLMLIMCHDIKTLILKNVLERLLLVI